MLGISDVASYADLFSFEEWEALTGHRTTTSHVVTIGYPPGQFEGNDHRYELDCDSCGHIGGVETLECAEPAAKLHEVFVASLLPNEEVPA